MKLSLILSGVMAGLCLAGIVTVGTTAWPIIMTLWLVAFIAWLIVYLYERSRA